MYDRITRTVAALRTSADAARPGITGRRYVALDAATVQVLAEWMEIVAEDGCEDGSCLICGGAYALAKQYLGEPDEQAEPTADGAAPERDDK